MIEPAVYPSFNSKLLLLIVVPVDPDNIFTVGTVKPVLPLIVTRLILLILKLIALSNPFCTIFKDSSGFMLVISNPPPEVAPEVILDTLVMSIPLFEVVVITGFVPDIVIFPDALIAPLIKVTPPRDPLVAPLKTVLTVASCVVIFKSGT